MNKIVHLKFGNDLIEAFEETRIALHDPNVKYQQYKEIVKVYFDHNLGILYTSWAYIFMVATITDESKFAVFMLKFPEYIEKIVYE